MSKKLLICMAIFSFAFIGSSFAVVENIKVSGDITAQALSRNFCMGLDNNAGTGDAADFLFSQIRLRFDADLTENVSAVIGLINERLWGQESNGVGENAEIDLDLGYVELKEFLYQPLSITVGRQPLRYGAGLIVGDPDTNQTADVNNVPVAVSDLSLRKSFDAVKAVLDYSPYTVDLIYAKVDEAGVTTEDDVTLYGTNVAYMWDSYNGLTEGYFFVSDNERANAAATINKDNSYTAVIGLRSQFDPNDHLTLSAESAYQFGDHYVDTTAATGPQGGIELDRTAGATAMYAHRKAWAVTTSAEYRFLNDYNAKVGGSYTLLSGDDANSKGFEGWDPMFEDTTCGELINVLFAATNCHLINFNGSFMPREDITLGLSYCRAMLFEKLPDSGAARNVNAGGEGAAIAYDTYNPTFGPAAGNTYRVDADNKILGDEIDVSALYDYTEDVQLKLTGAWFLPGDWFEGSDNRESAYSVRGGLTVNF